MITECYFDNIISVLTKIKDTQKEKMEEAAKIVAETIKND